MNSANAPADPQLQFRALQQQVAQLRGQGDAQAAQAVALAALQLRFSAQLALQLLELQLLPAVQWSQRASWLHGMQQLLERGHGQALVRLLNHVLPQYPLDQQRQQLLAALDEAQLFAGQSAALNALWQRLRRLHGRP